jgi:hypothetical protein
MKASTITKASAVALLLAVVTEMNLFAQDRRDSTASDHYAYVMVTGSNLPQKVKIKSIGTLTESPLRVYKRREIDQTGRFTTEDVLRQDPSLKVHGFGAAGGPGN